MNAETLSRYQFAFTASFHFIFPPLSMGLGVMLIVIGVAYVRTRNPIWRRLAFFWTEVYGLIFALGVATGLVQEFEFGMNWAGYSRFVGNVFGSLLAAEGVFAFFLEGGFLGLMLFGGNRLGPKLWLGATCVVVFAAHFSALWIVMANSWMQTPAGYKLVTSAGHQQAQMTDFLDVMFTPSFVPHILHVFVASWMAGAALLLSVSAWYLLRKRDVDFARAGFRIAVPAFGVLAVLQLVVFGANQAVSVTNNQPEKLAALEGLWNDKSCAPLFIFGWVNEANQTTKGFSIPCLLSFLSYGKTSATVQGLNSFNQDDWPPVNLAFQAYHLMIDLAMVFAGIGVLGAALYYWKSTIFKWRPALWVYVVTVFFVEATITSGWWTTEIGRQPWVVWQLLRTSDGVSTSINSSMVTFSLLMFVGLYAALLVLFLYLLNQKIQRGPTPLEEAEEVPVTSLPDSLREVFRRHPALATVPSQNAEEKTSPTARS
ncbi:MAG TPA: cytochrome ubiquinol oxidase subunit I [Dehalococcoidia bacterium]